MGSRTKYYTNLSAQHLFEEEENLFGKELARAAARAGSMRASDVLPAMIVDTMFFYNEKVFDKMGVLANTTIIRTTYTDEAIISYIKNNIDPEVNSLIFYTEKTNSSILKIDNMLDAKYPVDTSCSYLAYEKINNYVFSHEYHSWTVDDKRYIVDFGDTNAPVVKYDNILMMNYVTLLEIDEDCNVIEDSWRMEPFDEDTRNVMAARYERNDGTIVNIYFFSDSIIGESETAGALVVPIMQNKEIIGDDREYDFILSRFGLNGEDKDGSTFKDSIKKAGEDLKSVFLTYAVEYNSKEYKDLVDSIYSGGENRVQVHGEYSVKYYPRSVIIDCQAHPEEQCCIDNGLVDGSCFGTKYTIEVDRDTRDVDEEVDGELMPLMIIPVDYLKERKGLRSRINGYRDTFSIFAYSEKKVKIKWYETFLFRMIFMVIAVFIGVAMGFISFTAALVNISMSLFSMILQGVDPRLGAIFGLAMALFTFNPASFQSVLNTVNRLIRSFYSFVQYNMQSAIESINEEASKLSKETKEMRKEIADMWNQGLYIPLDTLDYMSNSTDRFYDFIEMSYNPIDMIEMQMGTVPSPGLKY